MDGLRPAASVLTEQGNGETETQEGKKEEYIDTLNITVLTKHDFLTLPSLKIKHIVHIAQLCFQLGLNELVTQPKINNNPHKYPYIYLLSEGLQWINRTGSVGDKSSVILTNSS